MTGYIEGSLTDPDAESRGCSETAEQSVAVAHRLALPAAQPARHRASTAGRPASRAGRRGHRPDVAARAADTLGERRRAGRARGRRLHAGEPQHRRRPSRHAVRASGGHPGPRGGGRQPRPADEPRPLPRADRRGKPDRAGPSPACRGSARSRSPTSPAAASRAPARSTTRRSRRRSTISATTASSGSRRSHPATATRRSTRSGRRSARRSAMWIHVADLGASRQRRYLCNVDPYCSTGGER